MFTHLPTFQKLIRCLQQVPYLASKNVYKVAGHFLTRDQKSVEQFCKTILDVKSCIRPCSLCHNWAENEDLCWICRSGKRDKSIICVVETWYDLFAIENSGQHYGVYHVLGGALCPLEGIGPNQLAIESLVKRLNEKVKEVIFATNPTPEGEATASFIWTRIKDHPIQISKLASGIPIGSTLEYMDRVTVGKALESRRSF